ncbi:MAG: acyl-CoA reductase [Flavobacteriales bacterium]|nr:acyl-CoA reductase [Flavobacteriales bacterium]
MESTINQRVSAMAALGDDLRSLSSGEGQFYHSFMEAVASAEVRNRWFTPQHSLNAAMALGEMLNKQDLDIWISRYKEKDAGISSKNVGLVLPGNVPMVGFHDLMCVLMAGHVAQVKYASDDAVLLPFLINRLEEHNAGIGEQVSAANALLKGYEAVIATGSNNSARYFKQYFGKVPHIIRKNRNAVAVLNGDESREGLSKLAADCMAYFGMGCRSVSKLYVPEGYLFDPLLHALSEFDSMTQHDKYRNNYDYNKALLLLNKQVHFDNGVVMLTENPSIASPVSVIHFEYYRNVSDLEELVLNQAEQLQCIVSEADIFEGSVPFGRAQHPALWDYADGVDTMAFLHSLS